MMTAKTSAIVAAMAMIWSALIALSVAHVTIEKSVYKDLVVEIKDNVPVAECATILNNLEVSEILCTSIKPVKSTPDNTTPERFGCLRFSFGTTCL